MQVTPSSANATEGIIAATPSRQIKIERMRILISPKNLCPDNKATALNARSPKPHYRGGATMSASVLGAWRPRMPDAGAQNVGYLFRTLRKLLRLCRREVKNDAVGLQTNLRGRQAYAVLAYAQKAADIGIHAGNLVVSAKLKGLDFP